jgi:hypothetical protein
MKKQKQQSSTGRALDEEQEKAFRNALKNAFPNGVASLEKVRESVEMPSKALWFKRL